MLDFLETTHNIKMSLHTLKSKLKSVSSSRKKTTPLWLMFVLPFKRSLMDLASITVTSRCVRHCAKSTPLLVQLRSNRRFVRRTYSSEGPNHVWHVDGYDKLKPYGLAISGCIDDYSRKVLWLKCGAPNNDPGVIAQNYIHCVRAWSHTYEATYRLWH
ncbi:hypothetical protein F7725_012010 [Dissostichus mawsoni]|uniref:Integrase core domain-containing protein n=1 Tax=Dissostichus mawsoni TaxID=36200 RepID=A0A7J5ZCP9_DISMA|nr:hypothetical protein F7725_012010 [Dissostichus mawsoni]